MVSENYRSKHSGERGVGVGGVNANKPCVTASEGIYFSMRLELSLGI